MRAGREGGLAAGNRGRAKWGVGAESGQGPKACAVHPQFSIGSDEDDSPLSGRAAFAKPLPSVVPRSDASPQHSVRYWLPAQSRSQAPS